jgi:hypothetical protein
VYTLFPKHQSALVAARTELGVREVPMGSNTGSRVRQYQATTFLGGSGWPWCAAFCCFVWRKAGKELPYRTASAYGMLNWAQGAGWAKSSKDLTPGDMVVFNVGSGHIAIFERWEGDTICTIDGNHNNMVARAKRPHSVVAGGIHVPEIGTPVHVPKPYWVIAASENGHRVLVFSKFATEKTVLGLLPRLFAKYGRAGITIKRGKERGK